MAIVQEVAKALATAFAMFWEVLWPLILGFGFSAVVRKRCAASAALDCSDLARYFDIGCCQPNAFAHRSAASAS